MTYHEIETFVYEVLGDTQKKIFSESMIREFANMTIRSINESRVLEKRGVIVLSAGTALYDLPGDYRRAWRVTYDGCRIDPVTTRWLDRVDDRWRERSGIPVAYYFENGQIGLYPKPLDDTEIITVSDAESGVIVSSADSEYGIVVDTSTNDGLSFDHEYGVMLNTVGARAVEVFYWASPQLAASESQPDVPEWASDAMITGILSYAYLADTLDRDYAKSRSYGMMFGDLQRRIDLRATNTIPKVCVAKGFGANQKMSLINDKSRRTLTVPE